MSTIHNSPVSPACVSCLYKKALDRYPADASRGDILAYHRLLGGALAHLPDCTSGPEMQERINELYASVFGDNAAAEVENYAALKRHFNRLMADFAETECLSARICAAADPLRLALGYAMTGNFIDFGAMSTVDETTLRTLLAEASDRVPADSPAYTRLVERLATTRRLVYLTDNCGEIVMDKLMIAYLRETYPAMDITVMVRGAPVLNDATMEDAAEVGLDRIPGIRVMGNGDGLAGTSLSRISADALAALESADLILAKGQGNYETLQGSGLPVCYAFLCKCTLFATRFSVPLYTGMLCWENGEDGGNA